MKICCSCRKLTLTSKMWFHMILMSRILGNYKFYSEMEHSPKYNGIAKENVPSTHRTFSVFNLFWCAVGVINKMTNLSLIPGVHSHTHTYGASDKIEYTWMYYVLHTPDSFIFYIVNFVYLYRPHIQKLYDIKLSLPWYLLNIFHFVFSFAVFAVDVVATFTTLPVAVAQLSLVISGS